MMMLSDLLQEQVNPDVKVMGVSDDSRRISTGDLFLAVAGDSHDGRDHVKDAIDRGAIAVLCDEPVPAGDFDAPVLGVIGLKNRIGELAARFHGEPSQKLQVIAVTGTNGKTSFTQLLAQAMTAGGRKSAVIGTMGYGNPANLREPGLTTPPAVELQGKLADLYSRGYESVVLEASSHGLAQGRLQGIQVDIAALTNITHDHLDYHASFDAYRDAKAELFRLPTLEAAILNRDDPSFEILKQCIAKDIRTLTYSSTSSADVQLLSSRLDQHGCNIEIQIGGGSLAVQLPLYGSFNIQNLLAVTAALVAMDWSAARIEKALAALTPVKGRMDIVEDIVGPVVIVDYAHTPDALQKSLTAVREHFGNAPVWCVFGCGGDRDRAKRSLMGEIAEQLADEVVLTSDNPRSEDPIEIINDISSGMTPGFSRIEPDRKKAITFAVSSATQSEVVLLAGKGHEEYQELADGRIDFSDYAVAVAAATSVSEADERRT